MRKIALLTFILLFAMLLQACELTSSRTYDIDQIIDQLPIIYAQGDDETHVTDHLGLPQDYRNDPKVSVSWTSSDPSVIGRFGAVNRPEDDTEITLELTVTIGTDTRTKTFDVTVIGTAIKHDVTFVAEGDETVVVAIEGMPVELPDAPQKEGYDFVGWSLDQVDYVPFDDIAGVTEDLMVYAIFEVSPVMADVVVTRYVESIEGGTYTALEDVTFEVEPGTEVTYEETLEGFVISQDSITFGFASEIEPLELVLYYDRLSYTVTYIVLDDPYDTELVRYEAMAFDLPLSVEGYTFDGWLLEDTPYDFNLPVTNDLTLVADLQSDEMPVYEGYYESINGLTGEALYDELNIILETTANLVNYGDARYILDETDRDPNRSSNVILVYTGDSVSGTWDGGATWNREHVWPQSLLGVSVSNSSISRGSDLQNLKPADPGVNSSRSNKYYDIYTTSTTFAPRAEVRGDLARILFYMVVMYDDMVLVSGSPGVHQMALFNRLLEWHVADPVDQFEMNRNDIIYQYQDNRNPFIDHPELVTSIWGETPGNTSRAYDLEAENDTYIIIYKPETDLLVLRRQKDIE
ncbi:MAG: endonuclease [Acholeplasmataceae bacterium]|nr:endonuclease [Acholeplasmataceae bacterium]